MSVKRGEPLQPIPNALRKKFKESLSSDEQHALELAEQYVKSGVRTRALPFINKSVPTKSRSASGAR
jgi:hypothetical protein